MQGTSIPLADVQRYISYTGTIVQLSTALMLALVFWLALRHARRHRHIVAWSGAWIALALALGVIVLRYSIMGNRSYLLSDDNQAMVQFIYAFYQAAKLLFYGLLCAGCLHYALGALPGWYVPATVTGGALVVIGSVAYAHNLDQFVSVQAPVAVLACLTCASLMFRLPASRRSTGSVALGVVFTGTGLLWSNYFVAFGVTGVLVSEYALPAVFETLVRYNSFFDAGANVALGYGTLLLLQEDAQREVDSAYGELAVGLNPRRRLGLHDSVTGSMNQLAFKKGLGLEAARATIGTVVALDIDRLKSINDAHGHAAGDALLRHLVEVLRSALRISDKLYRWGGDDFLLVLPNAQPARVKQRLLDLVENSPDLHLSAVQSIRLRLSIGVAGYSGAEDLPAAIERATIDQQRARQARKAAGPAPFTSALG